MRTVQVTPKQLRGLDKQRFYREYHKWVENQCDYDWWEYIYDDMSSNPEYYLPSLREIKPDAESTDADAWAAYHAEAVRLKALFNDYTKTTYEFFRVTGFDCGYRQDIDIKNMDFRLHKLFELGLVDYKGHEVAHDIVTNYITNEYTEIECRISGHSFHYNEELVSWGDVEDYCVTVLGLEDHDDISAIQDLVCKWEEHVANELEVICKAMASEVLKTLQAEHEWLTSEECFLESDYLIDYEEDDEVEVDSVTNNV